MHYESKRLLKTIKILPIRPPPWLIRAKSCQATIWVKMGLLTKREVQMAGWLAKFFFCVFIERDGDSSILPARVANHS